MVLVDARLMVMVPTFAVPVVSKIVTIRPAVPVGRFTVTALPPLSTAMCVSVASTVYGLLASVIAVIVTLGKFAVPMTPMSPPMYADFSMPIPPSVMMEPVSLDVESVVTVVDTDPLIYRFYYC
jgi:hypothetical protein